MKIIFTFEILFVACPWPLMTSWSLPSSLLFFILKGEREGSFILFFQVDLDFSLRGVFTTWAVHVRGKNWDFGKELSGKILISLGSVVLVSKWPLSRYTSNWNY